MDLNIILWIGGMLFSLGIFAIKVGFGLSFSWIRWKGILITLSLYLILFVAIAVLSGHLIKLLEPVLRKGPYLHALMALGMILWGILLLRAQKTDHRTQTEFRIQYPRVHATGGANEYKNAFASHSHHSLTRHSLLLLIPCPVCLTAMTFSTWSALNVVKFPAALVGMGLGSVFILLSLTVYFSLRFMAFKSSLITQRIGLGLGMIAIGLYFIASLFIPAKIEEAKAVYSSFLIKDSNIEINYSIGAFALLFAAFVVGYLMNKNREVK